MGCIRDKMYHNVYLSVMRYYLGIIQGLSNFVEGINHISHKMCVRSVIQLTNYTGKTGFFRDNWKMTDLQNFCILIINI